MRSLKAFTLVEAMTATVVGLFVILGAWAVYNMSWSWWHETEPFIEAEKITRLAIDSIINGNIDQTAGTDMIGSGTYSRRNGISWAAYDPSISSNIGVDDKIDFGLESDGGNSRSFYLGTVPNSTDRAIYYKDNTNTIRRLTATQGITDLSFSKTTDATVNKTYIRVTATVDRDVPGSRATPLHVHVAYTDTVFLRNI